MRNVRSGPFLVCTLSRVVPLTDAVARAACTQPEELTLPENLPITVM